MIICNECGEIFEEPMVLTENFPCGMGSAPYDWYVCPYCKDTNISKAIECHRCGTYISEQDSKIDDKLEHRYCDICYEDLYG